MIAATGTSRRFDTLLEGGSFYECPRWRDGRWYVNDIYRGMVLTAAEDGTDVRPVVEMDTMLSGTGWLPSGAFLVVAAQRRQVLIVDGGTVAVHADLSAVATGWLNDMVVDERGWAFVGDMGFDVTTFELGRDGVPPPGAVIPVAPTGEIGEPARGPAMPNGMVVDPANATLLVGETLGARYSAYSITSDGALTDRRTWADLARAGIAPDGCTLDANGRVWCADAFGQRCVLIAGGGDVLEELPMPGGLHAFACMLGGSEGRTLVVCCAPDFHPASRHRATDAVLLATTVDVPRSGRS